MESGWAAALAFKISKGVGWGRKPSRPSASIAPRSLAVERRTVAFTTLLSPVSRHPAGRLSASQVFFDLAEQVQQLGLLARAESLDQALFMLGHHGPQPCQNGLASCGEPHRVRSPVRGR